MAAERGSRSARGCETQRPAAAEEELLNAVTEENVLLQLAHLRTHPSVARRLAERTLAVQAWVYDIGQGDVRIHDPGSNRFVPIDELRSTAAEQQAAASL